MNDDKQTAVAKNSYGISENSNSYTLVTIIVHQYTVDTNE